MAETVAQDAGVTDDEGADEAPPAAPPRRRRLLMLALAVLALLGAAGGGAWYFMAGGAPAKEAEAPPDTFVDVPPMQVAIRAADGSSRSVKIHVMLVPGTAAPDMLTKRLPLLIDRFQPFVRELRPDDLSGSAATFRIKEEMLVRANQIFGEGAVRDVLIQDLMVG